MTKTRAAVDPNLYAPLRPKPAPVPHKLVDSRSGADVPLPVYRKLWNGAPVTVIRFEPNVGPGKAGLLFDSLNYPLCPSTLFLSIVPVTPSEEK
jgi:hypothetical protein